MHIPRHRGAALASAALVLTTALSGCQRSATPPSGRACLPGSAVARQCRDVRISSHPQLLPSQTPQLPVQAFDPAFAAIVGRTPKLIPLASGFGFLEGPVYVQNSKGPDGMLFVTDQIHNSIYSLRWNGLIHGQITAASWQKPQLFRNPSGVADGQSADLEGNLLTTETTGRRISMTRDIKANLSNVEAQATTLVSRYRGTPLNSPNDLVVKSDGTVWFTDPSYGSLQFPPQPAQLRNNVYRYDPRRRQLSIVDGTLLMPNGIAFGPGERTLYVIDSAAIQGPQTYFPYLPHRIDVYDVSADGRSLSRKRLFANVAPGFPDGMRLDQQGNVYVGTLEGVHVLNRRGRLIGKLLMPKQTANLSFGGADNNILFIGASDTLWAIKLNTRGLVPVRARPL